MFFTDNNFFVLMSRRAVKDIEPRISCIHLEYSETHLLEKMQLRKLYCYKYNS